MTASRRSLAVSSLGVLSLAPVIVGCAADAPAPEETDAVVESPAVTPAPEAMATEAPEATEPAEYADGTYEAEGGYQSPNGPETVRVSITLSDGVISAVEVTPQGSGTSERYQGQFAGGIAVEAVGKSLDALQVSRIAGSSLTSGGFNEALATIKADATR